VVSGDAPEREQRGHLMGGSRPTEDVRSRPRTAEQTGAAILVVDDDAGKRMATVAVLEPLGLVIVEAASGEMALREVMKRDFAVILMDVQMPGMDGYETASMIRMRRQSEDTPIIFITSLTRIEAKIPVAYASGAVDFMFVPVVPGILRAKVSIFVDLFHKTLALEQAVRHVTALGDDLDQLVEVRLRLGGATCVSQRTNVDG
jgi:hypothetical protein